MLGEDAAAVAVEYPNDEELLEQVLRCYKPHCKYLKSATLSVTEQDGPVAQGTFEIPESCYIDDTGHLNAVEVNICYNQLMYYAVAKTVREQIHPAFATWTMEDYWARQLPDILIVRFQSAFKRPIDPRSFGGEFRFTEVAERESGPDERPRLSVGTAARYWDDSGGRAESEVRLAIIDTRFLP